MKIGFTPHGIISKKKRIFWEGQFFALIRSYRDGITFIHFKINLDTYRSKHAPSFQIEFVFLNVYNHLWVYQNNPDE